LGMNHIEAVAELTLAHGAEAAVSPPSYFGFITTFGKESFSAAVLPSGSGDLELGKAQQVTLRFLVPAAAAVVLPGAVFIFVEPPHRSGAGRILGPALAQQGSPHDGCVAHEPSRCAA
jgi:hypothetical protein